MPCITRKSPCLRIGTALLAFGSSLAVAAPALEEIIVTAQKREESLQDTPISLAVFDARRSRPRASPTSGTCATTCRTCSSRRTRTPRPRCASTCAASATSTTR